MRWPTRPTGFVIALALLAWLAIVIYTTSRHEFWRDEVRALSLVRAAESPLDLYRVIETDGHPVLWYLLLYIGISIVDSPVVLPVVSILVAFAGVALFMLAAPFPLWLRTLFIFSALPLYEYSVMARNYGISMLLLFAAAALFPTRLTHPVRFGFVLALLANTNVHSTLLVGLIGLVWVLGVIREPAGVRSRGWQLAGFTVAAAGIALCATAAMPRENTILTSLGESLSDGELTDAAMDIVMLPGGTFGTILPEAVPVVFGSLVLYVTLVGLVRRPELFAAGLAALVGFGVFFRIIYPGFYRHQGLLLMFFVVLYWIYRQPLDMQARADSPAPGLHDRRSTGLLHTVGLYVGLLFLIVSNVAEARHAVLNDVRGDKSSSRAFGTFLRSSPEYRHAVIVPEPGYIMEALPYYAGNTIYMPREHRYSPTVLWTTDSRLRFTLGALVAEARRVAAAHPDRPVLIVLHADLLQRPSGTWEYMYAATFEWTPEEFEALRRATREVALFNSAYEDERYRVLELVQR